MAVDRPRMGLHHPTVVPTNFDPDEAPARREDPAPAAEGQA